MHYQAEAEFHPAKWFTGDRSVTAVQEILDETSEQYTLLKRVHMTQLKLFVIIDLVLEEQKCSTLISDSVDEALERVNQNKKFKMCLRCGLLVPKSKRKCPQCKDPLSSLDTLELSDEPVSTDKTTVEEVKCGPFEETADGKLMDERYEFVPDCHPDASPTVTLLDPVFVNPNSYDNLVLVLRHIGRIAKVKRYGGQVREWVTVCCDGLPYSMILRLTQDYLICKECGDNCIGEDSFEEHKMRKHQGSLDVECVREFDWVLLHTGDGHYEMNLLKSFFELNWDVCLKQLAQRMGWKSELALKSAKNCYDNHKTWQLFEIFYFGTLMELVVPYVRKCIAGSVKANVDGYLVYAAERRTDPNYTYIFEMVTRYSQAIMNFRIGVRRNNATLIQSAKMMARGLFHGRNHPKYQEIEISEVMLRHLMPADLKDFFEKHESMTKTSDHSKGQSYDFILEELNKEVKSWLRRGIPTDSMWLCVCRNHDLLKQIKQKTIDLLLNDKVTGGTRKVTLSDGIFEWRVYMRDTAYLTNDRVLHTDILGHSLHPSLVNFTEQATRKRAHRMMETFLESVELELPDSISLKKPVYVTQEEAEKFESLENSRIEDIDKLTMQMINSITDLETKKAYLDKYKKVCGKRKDIHITFFSEVAEVLEESLAQTVLELDLD